MFNETCNKPRVQGSYGKGFIFGFLQRLSAMVWGKPSSGPPPEGNHHNNFNVLRLLLASLVVYSHAYALIGLEEPVVWGKTLGSVSVHGFFAISGYLICQSFGRSRSTLQFTVNRLLRIVPGLVVAIVLSRYVSSLCDGFLHNPVPHIYNGPIWTLTWEAVCYIGVVILGLCGVLARSTLPGFFAAAWLLYLYNLSSSSNAYLVIAPLAMMFLAGAFICVMEDQIVFSKFPFVSICGIAITFDHVLFEIFYAWLVANIPFLWGPAITAEQASKVIYLSAFPAFIVYLGKYSKPVLPITNDVSYGIYVYGWPIAQVIIYLANIRHFQLKPIPYFILTMLVTVPIAFMSWKLVESPMMRLKKYFYRL